MPTLFMRSVLFLCSYFPLTAILCILQSDVWPWWVTTLVAALPGAGSVLLTWLYLRLMRRSRKHGPKDEHATVERFSRRDADVMSYIASYLFPLATYTLGGWKQGAALGIFIGVLYLLYVYSTMIYINPMLNLVGFRLYEIELAGGTRSYYYIARKRLERQHTITFVRLSDDIFLER